MKKLDFREIPIPNQGKLDEVMNYLGTLDTADYEVYV